MPYYYIDDDLNKIQGIDSNLDQLVNDHLCKSINNDKD